MDLFRHTTELGSHVSCAVCLSFRVAFISAFHAQRHLAFLFFLYIVLVSFKNRPPSQVHRKTFHLSHSLVAFLRSYVISFVHRWRVALVTRTGYARVLSPTNRMSVT